MGEERERDVLYVSTTILFFNVFFFFADVSAKRSVTWIDFRVCVDTWRQVELTDLFLFFLVFLVFYVVRKQKCSAK